MIEFQLDHTSGAATYWQLVQQVRQAPWMGVLAIYRTAFRDCFAEGVA